MSKRPEGIRRPLSPARKFVCEMIRYAQKVPSIRVSRRMNVLEIATARKTIDPRPAWSAIFMKAFALVARNHPYLRQVYMSFPWARLYEYPHSIGVLMIEREYRGEQVVLGTKIRSPETQTLAAITKDIRRHKEEPVENLARFRMALMSGSLPWPLRRLQWWSTLYLSGFKRVKRFGTFAVSSVGHLGADSHPIGPITTILSYGPISEESDVDFSLVLDHRVLDAANAARCLAEIETTLYQDILTELKNGDAAS